MNQILFVSLCFVSVVLGTAVPTASCSVCRPGSSPFSKTFYPIMCGDSTCCYPSDTDANAKWTGKRCLDVCYNQMDSQCCDGVTVCTSPSICCGIGCVTSQDKCCNGVALKPGQSCCGGKTPYYPQGNGGTSSVSCCNPDTGYVGTFCETFAVGPNGTYWKQTKGVCTPQCPLSYRNGTYTRQSTCAAPASCGCMCPDEDFLRCASPLGTLGCADTACIFKCPIFKPATCVGPAPPLCSPGSSCGNCGPETMDRCLLGNFYYNTACPAITAK